MAVNFEQIREKQSHVSPLITDINKASEKYLVEVLKERGGYIDFQGLEERHFVVYDGGGDECVSNANSMVDGIGLCLYDDREPKIYLDTEDTGDYDLKDMQAAVGGFGIYSLAEYVHNNLAEIDEMED